MIPLQTIAFYLMAAATIGAGLAVVFARNPVHSVLFLITAFFSAAGLFVLMGAEFLAMLLVVVYVGAVAVLFLFVVLMLAMIGAIVLTLRHKPGVKRQNIAAQNARTPAAGMTIVDIKPGEGIS